MNLKQAIRRILREDKLYITPQELVKNLPQELKELLFKQWGAKQNPEWHPEGNTLKHILVVIRRAYHHYPDDPNMIMAALFHDLGKIDTYKINPKTGQPTAYGHEDKSTDYVEQFREWIESFEGTDVDEIKYLVKNHMKVKPSTWDQMKDKKKEPIKSHPAFDKLMGFTDKLDGGGVDLKETIRRILREELSVKVRRRVPLDEMETEFLESFETAYRILKNKKVSQKDFLDKLIYTTATVMMDGIHWRLFSSFPKDDNSWYDEIQSELENHYRDRIIQMYNEKYRGINESILTEASKVKTLVDKVGLTQGNAVELDRLCGSLSIWMANKLINHQQGINTSWNKTNQTGLETLNDRGVDRFRSLITSIMDWIRIGLNGNLGDNKNLTFSDLVLKSQEWHQSLNIGDGDINYVEKNPIVLDFRDENGNGFYWVDLETSNSPEECNRMGHCGRSSFGNLYSLREFKPLNDKYKVNKSHLTASIGSDGILYQLKGPKNSKPKEELHGYITPLFYVLGGGGEEDDYLIQGFGSEYASQKDFKISDLSDEVIKDLYRNRPELFNTRGLQRKLAELGYIELPEINYNIKVNIGVDEVGSYVDGDWVISRRKVKRTTPGGIEYEQTIERTLFEDILTGETWDLYEPGEVDWRGIVDYYMDDENAKYIRDILLKVASKTEDFNQEDFDEESLENLIEEYDDNYEIRSAIRNAGESIERSEYYDYLYKELKSSLEEYGSVEKMDDTGVTLNVNVKPYLEEHDEDIIDEILDECNDDYNCVFRYLVREEMIIDRPKFETSDYWSPDYKDKEELNSMINDYLSDAERAYSK